jgi:uncharacterized protein YutE (UPF0331/DUF86 family)
VSQISQPANLTAALARIPGLDALDHEALRHMAQALDLDLVILFGSTVRGRRRAGSDLLVSLASYVDELESWLTHPPEPDRPLALQRIVERLLQVILECAADAGDLWLTERGLPSGESARGVFQRLREAGTITPELEQHFATHTRMRNRIVHAYDEVDAPELIDQASRLPADARARLAALIAR